MTEPVSKNVTITRRYLITDPAALREAAAQLSLKQGDGPVPAATLREDTDAALEFLLNAAPDLPGAQVSATSCTITG